MVVAESFQKLVVDLFYFSSNKQVAVKGTNHVKINLKEEKRLKSEDYRDHVIGVRAHLSRNVVVQGTRICQSYIEPKYSRRDSYVR